MGKFRQRTHEFKYGNIYLIVDYTIDEDGNVYEIDTVKWKKDHITWQPIIIEIGDLINAINDNFYSTIDRILNEYEETLTPTLQDEY